jgi:hypothetical protein
VVKLVGRWMAKLEGDGWLNYWEMRVAQLE